MDIDHKDLDRDRILHETAGQIVIHLSQAKKEQTAVELGEFYREFIAAAFGKE